MNNIVKAGLLILLAISPAIALVPDADVALVDGKIMFRNGYIPSAFELALSTSGIKFENFSDYKSCVDNKDYMDDKISDLKPSEAKRFKASIDYLKAENAKK